MTQVNYLQLVQAFEKLFISSKQRRIEQQDDGSYYVKHNGLGHSHLIEHLKGVKTVGVFSGDVYSKYLCFDVDTGTFIQSQARNDVRVLIYALISEFDISNEYITVADSGNKGYHIYLFFDDVIHVEYLRAFYREVLERTGYDPTEIEFRPTATQGVKLPLGIHKVTGRRCHFVNHLTSKFSKRSDDYIHEIKQLDTALFKAKNNLKDLYEIQEEYIYLQLCKFMYDSEARSFAGICQSLDFTEYQIEHAETDMIKMLQEKTLIYPDTRNKYTLLLAVFLKGQGHEQQDVEKLINEIMLNSKRNYNNLVNASERHIHRETSKITKYVFNKRNLSISTGNQSVALYGDEIRDILALGNVPLMKLYLTMLVYSKRHQVIGTRDFYMAYSIMMNYGNTSNRSRLRNLIYKLEQLGRVEVVQSGEKDYIRSEVEGRGISKTNIYRIKKSFNHNSDEKVIIKADIKTIDVNSVLIQALDENVISIADVRENLSEYNFKKFKQSL